MSVPCANKFIFMKLKACVAIVEFSMPRKPMVTNEMAKENERNLSDPIVILLNRMCCDYGKSD